MFLWLVKFELLGLKLRIAQSRETLRSGVYVLIGGTVRIGSLSILSNLMNPFFLFIGFNCLDVIKLSIHFANFQNSFGPSPP